MHPAQIKAYPPKRNLSVAGGVMVVIAACFALIAGPIYFVVAIDYEDIFYLIVGIWNMFAFSWGIASAVVAFKMKWRVVAILGPAFLIAGCVLALEAIFTIVPLILSILGAIFIALAIPHYLTSAPQPMAYQV